MPSTQWSRDASEIKRKARIGICTGCYNVRPLREVLWGDRSFRWCQWCLASEVRRCKAAGNPLPRIKP